ncbi:MAG: DUF4142 domain-containing protein [Sphingomicrobium sp.]
MGLAIACFIAGCDPRSDGSASNNANGLAADIQPAKSSLPTTAQAFASAMAANDAYEIESSKLALQRSRSPGVNEMAQMLLREHSQSSAELKAAAAGTAGVSLPTAFDPERQKLFDELKSADASRFGKAFMDQQRTGHIQTLMIVQNYRSAGDNEALKRFAAGLQARIEFHLARLNATSE